MMKHRTLSILALTAVGLAGCARTPVIAPPPATGYAQMASARQTKLPALDAGRLQAEAYTYRYVEVTGGPGAAQGDGVWVCIGEHTEPQRGWKAPVQADGSFARPLDKPDVEKVTVWAYVEEGPYYRWSTPVVVTVRPAGATKRPAIRR